MRAEGVSLDLTLNEPLYHSVLYLAHSVQVSEVLLEKISLRSIVVHPVVVSHLTQFGLVIDLQREERG